MRAKIARIRTMMTAADTLDRARPFAAAMVEREERRTGSRMSAYEIVGQSVGVTASWLRKLIGRQPLVVEHHEFLNLAAAYRRICERVEAEAEIERRKLAVLRGQADAALEGIVGVGECAPQANDRGTEEP